MHKKVLLLILLICLAPALQAAPLPKPDAPHISARSYIIRDFNSSQVLASKQAHIRMEPASITKLMTAYLIFRELRAGRLKLTDRVYISKKAWRMPGSRTFVEVGKKIPVDVLLRGLIVQSGNDATVALAEHVGGSEETFVSLMNKEARRLKMTSTHFMNSTGLPHKNHYSTAHDLSLLAQALIRDFPDYYHYYSIKKYKWNGIQQYNRNRLLWRDKTVDGLKTGHTESAGYCLVSSAKRGGMRLITVVLGDKNEERRAVSSLALLNYGFRFFETRKLFNAGQSVKKVRVWKGENKLLDLGPGKDVYVTIPRGHYKKLRATISITPRIMAPVRKQARYGVLNISLDGNLLSEYPLLAQQEIARGGMWRRFTDSIRLWFD
jgi:D-alanyl-D-alanine carboxypeptidase (penicillin-binding protein 5/6)